MLKREEIKIGNRIIYKSDFGSFIGEIFNINYSKDLGSETEVMYIRCIQTFHMEYFPLNETYGEQFNSPNYFYLPNQNMPSEILNQNNLSKDLEKWKKIFEYAQSDPNFYIKTYDSN